MDEKLSDEEKARVRKVHRGCLISLMPFWVGLTLATILGIVYILGDVERDPETITAKVATFLEMDLPEGFEPFSMNSFLGTRAISFYHRDHVREDGRTTSVVSIQREWGWRDMTLKELETEVFKNIELRLEKREFKIGGLTPIKIEQGGETFYVYHYSGRQLIDEEAFPAHTCFRFMMGPDGPFQVQSMGLEASFPSEQQLAVLTALRARK